MFCLPRRLGFAAQHVFNRLARALLVPIFRQASALSNPRVSSSIQPELQKALVWWRNSLQSSMCEVRRYRPRVLVTIAWRGSMPFLFAGTHVDADPDKANAFALRREVGVRFCCSGAGVDVAYACAESTLPRIGAVLMTATFGDLRYTDCAPLAEIVEQFQIRRDNQIASLEMLAIAYGLLVRHVWYWHRHI